MLNNGLPAFLVLLSACSFTPPDVSTAGTDPGQDASPAAADAGSADAVVDAPPNALRRDIRIMPPAAVTGDVQDVAIPIRLVADSHFMQNADPGGPDILVQTEGGTTLAIDFEILDVSAGELLAWVKAPTVARTGTDLFLKSMTPTSS